jgi:hypothetical protein
LKSMEERKKGKTRKRGLKNLYGMKNYKIIIHHNNEGHPLSISIHVSC